ncbi:MAG: transporter substrate-binding domain-containing protein [Planktotalea sp.]|uniref:transporter substrate-binding domain-containing protein n=1 Tax=Planktotalea sp. TaxID=2029877 RepID=UPI003C71D7B6
MTHVRTLLLTLVMSLSALLPAAAQSTDALTIATVHRPPFVFVEGAEVSGFSIDLMRAVAQEIGKDVEFAVFNSFAEMFEKVQNAEVDGAVANISITTERERLMDFSQPIFASGIKILMPNEASGLGLFSALLTWDIGLIVLSGLALLMCGGLLMWLFERKHQDYFNKPAREALFPSFWWALNLVVNGGFEERVPRSPFGRIFAVILVVASLFIVSIFVASITAATTVNALNSNVQNLRDLEKRTVGTVEGSTSANFLTANGLAFAQFANPDEMLSAFEQEQIDAAVFDGPILAYYQQTRGGGKSRLLERTYRPENYGIALPSGHALKEEIDQVLPNFRVDGTYDALLLKWFGNIYSPD